MQRGGIAALDDGDAFVREQVARAQRARDIVCGILAETGRARFSVPPGAFYLFFSIDGMNGFAGRQRSTSSTRPMSAWRPAPHSAKAVRDSAAMLPSSGRRGRGSSATDRGVDQKDVVFGEWKASFEARLPRP